MKSKFSDLRWHRKRDELLEQASNCCEECESTVGVQIHICYGDSEADPWEWPDNSFRCLCEEHKRRRQDLDKDIRRALAQFTTQELDPLADALDLLVQMQSNRSVAMNSLYSYAKSKALRLDPETEFE
jgi:hypothetical protein